MMRHVIAAVMVTSAMLGASHAWAQDPVGCDKFKWDVTRERAALARADIPKLAFGSDMAGAPPQATALSLQPSAEAKLPSTPERAPKPGTFAGFTTVKNIPASGIYSVTLSTYAWVDVVQNGAFLKPKAFSGVSGCDGIRKTIKFDLAAGSAVIQISGVQESAINIAVMPVAE